MRRFFAAAAGLCACICLGSTTQGQAPPGAPAPATAPPAAPSAGYYQLVPVPGPAAETAPVTAPAPLPWAMGEKEAMFAMDVLLGQQTGIRAQAALVRGDR